MRIIGVVLAAIFGVVTFSAPLIAQQKTEKACQEEWRANKAANQAKGITEKAYVTQCRGGDPSTQPTAAPTTPAAPGPAPTATPAAPAQPRTATAPASRPAPGPTST